MFLLLSSKLFILEWKTIKIWMPFPSFLLSTSSCWNVELKTKAQRAWSIKKCNCSLFCSKQQFSCSLLEENLDAIHYMYDCINKVAPREVIHSTLSNPQEFSVCMHLFLVMVSRESNMHSINVVCTHPENLLSLSITWKQWHSSLLPSKVRVNIKRELKAGDTIYEIHMHFAKCHSCLDYQGS